MKVFVPHLCDTIEQLLDEHEDVMNEERLNGELLYNLLLLSEIVDGKSELVHYIDRLTKILDKTLHMKSTEANRMSATLLQVIGFSLSFTQPTEYRSMSESLDLDVKDFLPIRNWGCPGDLNNLNIHWYTPGEKEIACIQSVMDKYLVPELEKLQTYSTGKLALTRDELHRSLKIIISLLGAQSVLPLWKEPPLQLVDSAIEPWAFELIVSGPYTVTMPDGRNVRKVIADVICDVQKFIQTHDEGDTISITCIIQIYDVLLFNKNRGRDFEMRWKSHHLTKKSLEDRLQQKKKHIRNVLIDRVMLHQEFRNDSRSCSFTATHRQLLLALFELAVSRYSAVRICAQSKLFNVVSTYSYSYILLTPYLKEILMMDSAENHEKFKGCLYILLGPKGTPIVARHNWAFIREIWPTLILSKPSEKQSIVNLMTSLNDVINRYFPTIHITLKLSEKCIERALELANTSNVINLDNFQEQINNSAEKMKKNSGDNLTTYNDILDMLLSAAANRNLHWRHQTMSLSLIQYLVHPDVIYNADIVKYFLSALVNDSIAIRKIALKVMLFVMLQNKPKFKKIATYPYNSYAKDKKIVPGIRSDNKWLLYDSQTVPKDAKEWDTPRYVHDQFTGFYSWPRKLEMYAPSSEQPTFNKRKDNLTSQETVIYEFFKNQENVNLLVKYWSMEEKKGRDQFNVHRFLLVKNLFKIFEDELLDFFIPHLKQLVSDTQEHNQRCASELISGIIQGSKHWSFQKVEKLWTILLPILRTAFNNITDETIIDWGVCIAMSVEYRDPNRHHWLLEFLMDDPLSEPTSFIGCARIYMLQSALNQQPWRNAELINRLLEYFGNHLAHQFQNVREKISACLVILFCKDIVFPEGNFTNCPRVSNFFAQIMPKLNTLYAHSLKSLEARYDTNNIEEATNQLESVSLNESDKEECIRLFKTVSKYVTGSVARMNYSAVSEHYNLLPLACILQNNDNDDELKTICSNFLAILGSTIILDKYVPAALEAAQKVSTCPSWSARSVIVEFISVLVFHNLAVFITQEEWVLQVQNMVLQLLEDIQPEVRLQTGKVLSGLLHCKFLPKPMELLEIFKQKAKTKLKRSTTNKKIQKNGINLSVSVRHAGVLGMCAFISSHPYDVPDYLPNIFAELGVHLNDPQPIPATIRKTLGDFKRTHHDNWEVHKLKFTEEELSVLSDLTVPPSYYA
ncbi:Proteasome-substrate-size regulator, mid region [Popillia japonica]|uniref:Proteasome-substrate-size regulator, mid region n=1 Tax=Popillia japonica TaxID=7064 RepID=A0AAW1N1M3_POPJA